MDEPDIEPVSKAPVLPRSYRLIRRLAWLYGLFAAALGGLLLVDLFPSFMPARLWALSHEVIVGGMGGTVLSTLLLPLTALLGTLALIITRLRFAAVSESSLETSAISDRRRWSLDDPGFAARQGQAFIVSVGTLLIWVTLRYLWPTAIATTDVTAANVAAAFVFAMAFVALVTERTMRDVPAALLPEAPTLRRLLLLTTLLLSAAGCAQLGRGAHMTWVRWPAMVLICVPSVVALELMLRALARLFLPPPPPATAVAVTDSLFTGLLTGGARAPGTLLRTHLGLDFARSWALSFLSAAILPAVFGTALLCWGLSGTKLIELGQRGIYERFGAPVAVLGPGLHLLLPWPLGRLRPVEYGTIHSVPIGVDQTQADSMEPPVGAEAIPPLSLNRLWESSHPGQADYLVPGPGAGQEGFQSVSTEISVLYRVGLTDNAALQSVYSVADPETLIKDAASRLVLRYFNSRTLDAVLGARRENVAGTLRKELTADIDAHHAGIDIVSVLIEEIHPPAGAAEAYHAVQAAEINANASISNEIGRAKRTAGVAQQEAHALTTAANAKAAETLHAANSDAYRFIADQHAYTTGGNAFLLERRFTDLEAALGRTPLTIVDHRLSAAQAPIIDLRTLTPSIAGIRSSPTPAATTGPVVTQSSAGAGAGTTGALPPIIPAGTE